MFAGADDALKYIADNGIAMVDLKITAVGGQWLHVTIPATSFGELHELVGLGHRRGDRFFDQHVAAGLQQHARGLAVIDRRRRDHDGVGIARLASAIERPDAVLRGDPCQSLPLRVKSAEKTDPLHATEDSDVVPAEMARTDDGCGDHLGLHDGRG